MTLVTNQSVNTDEQKYLQELDKKLWIAADKLRTTLSAAEYKHAVLGLIFLKYVSDTFEERRIELDRNLRDPEHEIFLNPNDFGTPEEYEAEIQYELEVRDSYTEKNVFWVPERARWNKLVELAKLPVGAYLPWVKKNPNGEKYEKMKGADFLIDDALDAIEKDNSKLKGILNKTYTRLNLDNDKLSELIDHINTIPPAYGSLHAKDILGHVYEFFLGEFASAEGKKGGQYYTPKSIVTLFVEMLQPFKGRVYDPAMGSGGFFVQSERFVEKFGGRIGDISVYGQEYNHTTWQLAAMNMAIRGIDFNFGHGPANTLTNDLHPDLRADYIMANPPFNMREWWNEKLEGDPRWKFGAPPQGNANFAWLQHMIYHLAPHGSMGLLLSNGSMSSTTSGEGEIRESVLKADLVECMVALPGQLFTNTQIPACIWFLTKNKESSDSKRDRSGEVLFIDAREKGYMKDRVLRDFTEKDIADIADVFHAWQTGKGYEDVLSFCKSVKLEEIVKNEYILTPGRYVGSAETKGDVEPFDEKMKRLTGELKTHFDASDRLEQLIKEQLGGLGYGV
ncbi:class I SAM-dependent DNA methyltransferase [Pontibacter oryzae]|uniref:site-specific DNA-methyltransferase (adenine-specific) n=1 Tax=Pontibacter oryzae TaxID=2304593 RepID=A0A399SIE7_9BACT|nr:class I SAM-dependent DNA methyltransferase [Pontibacter oryzae]RIJ42659.1 SAM-dependent DNA methyltransferase [Pontibacter oryzae]